jgi:hypothetical protein
VRSRPTRRRALGLAALAGAAGAAPLLSGCSVDSSLDRLRPTPPPTPVAPANPDQPLVDRVTTSIRRLLPTAPAAWSALHERQLQALGTAYHGTLRPGALDHAAETALRDQLLDGCAAAQDPELARLLAAMAAGVSQLLGAA